MDLPAPTLNRGSSYVLAIDPGNRETGFVLADAETLQPIEFDKIDNHRLLQYIYALQQRLAPGEKVGTFAIERVASYGLAVGKEVFETCEWIGRFTQCIYSNYGREPEFIYRKEEKQYICGDLKAKDTNIRRALIDRFAQHDLKSGKGTKKNPDWFYGFRADVWAAYACAVVWSEKQREAAAKTRG